ncbi:unnamed protein product [Amoebophrya sp. A25]|nr:unnamed protein product [Amoebophrya sp. A25]|eukprot:GSA25T00001766001.1
MLLPEGTFEGNVLTGETLGLAGIATCTFFTFWLWMCSWQEKGASYFYLGVAFTSSAAELALFTYPYYSGSTGKTPVDAGGNFVDVTHYNLELLAWSAVWAIMMAVCVVDSLIYMPLDTYKLLKKGEAIPGFVYQVYYHHILGLLGMVPSFLHLKALGGYDLTRPPTASSADFEKLTLLNTLRFCNRFVYFSEFSTIFLHSRNIMRLKALETGIPTPTNLRIGAGLAFAFSFFLCRILPMGWGVLQCLNCGVPFLSNLLAQVLEISRVAGLASWLFPQQVVEQGPIAFPQYQITAGVAACYFGFCFLNFYWGYEIWKGVSKALGFGGAKAEKGKKKA